MYIKIINSHDGNWYKVGEVFRTNPNNPYGDIGCRVFRDGFDSNSKYPDVVMNGDYEIAN